MFLVSWLIGKAVLGALTIAVAAGVVAAVYVLFLKWSDIIRALRGWKSIKEKDINNIGFLLKEGISNGNISYVTGIWSQKDERILTGTRYEAKDSEEDLRNLDEAVIFS